VQISSKNGDIHRQNVLFFARIHISKHFVPICLNEWA
jgi:hypothetical protein